MSKTIPPSDKKPPADADSWIRITKDRHSQQGESEDQINKYKEGEVKEIRAETDKTLAEISNVKAKKLLEEAKRGIYSGANTVIDRIFSGKSADEVTKILETMSPQALQNLLAMERSVDTPASVAVAQQTSGGRSEVDRLIDVMRIMKEMQPPPQPQQQMTVAQIIDIVKAVQGGGGGNAMEAFSKVAEIYKPVLESNTKAQKEVMDLRMKEMKENQPPDPIEQIRYIKEAAGTLGLTSGQKSEIDLKLEEMKQEREIDMKRLDWEQKKYEMDADAENQKWEGIGKILEGPVGKAIQGIGNAGADRVRGKSAKMPKPVQTQCPQCNSVIFVDQDADAAVCGHCGVVLQKAGTPAQPPPETAQQPAPQPTRVDAPPPEAAPATPSESTQEEEEHESDEPQGEEEGTESQSG